MDKKHSNQFKLLKSIIDKKIIYPITDKKVKKILYFFMKRVKDFSSKDIVIDDTESKKFSITIKNFTIRCFKNNSFYLQNFCPINKLNKINFPNIVKIIDYDENFNLYLFEKLVPIVEDNRIKNKFNNKKFIKNIIIVLLKNIFSLYLYNNQVNKLYSYNNFGIDSKGNLIINDIDNSKYLDPKNINQVKNKLYSSFKLSSAEILSILSKNIKLELSKFLERFEDDLTIVKTIEIISLTGTYKKIKIRLFKVIDVDGIINYVNRW